MMIVDGSSESNASLRGTEVPGVPVGPGISGVPGISVGPEVPGISVGPVVPGASVGAGVPVGCADSWVAAGLVMVVSCESILDTCDCEMPTMCAISRVVYMHCL